MPKSELAIAISRSFAPTVKTMGQDACEGMKVRYLKLVKKISRAAQGLMAVRADILRVDVLRQETAAIHNPSQKVRNNNFIDPIVAIKCCNQKSRRK